MMYILMRHSNCFSAANELIIFEGYFLEVYCYNLLKKTGTYCCFVVVVRLVQCNTFICLVVALLCIYMCL